MDRRFMMLGVILLGACGSGSPVNPGSGSASVQEAEQGTGSGPELGGANGNTGGNTGGNTAGSTTGQADGTATASAPDGGSADPREEDNGEPGEAAGGSTDNTVNEPVSCARLDLDARLSVLERINEVRANARYCGDEWFEAAPPLSWDDRLEQAAIRHSSDMATHDVFSHTGTDGSSVGDRADTVGYSWNRIGENIAAGQQTADDAITGWVASTGHCRNLMQPAFTDMALACESNASTQYGRYWTQVLGNEP